MLAVIELGGNQFTVQVGDVIEVKHQDVSVDSVMTLKALLISDTEGKNVQVGTPVLENSKVELKVLDQFKGEKVRVFKMKSKKRYTRNKGFRPEVTELEVLSIA